LTFQRFQASIFPILHLVPQFFSDGIPNSHLGPKTTAAILPEMREAVTLSLKVFFEFCLIAGCLQPQYLGMNVEQR
jgi:hypothetical protein